jgi:hypothetical protein
MDVGNLSNIILEGENNFIKNRETDKVTGDVD